MVNIEHSMNYTLLMSKFSCSMEVVELYHIIPNVIAYQKGNMVFLRAKTEGGGIKRAMLWAQNIYLLQDFPS